MGLSVTNISVIRSAGMGLAGLSCLIYAVLAVVQNRPDPVWWFIPGAMGIGAAVVTAVVFAIAGRAVAGAASDELYRSLAHRAQRHAFWCALGFYPVFALLVIFAGLGWDTAFAAMGTLTAAVFLLLVVIYEWIWQ